MPGAAVRAERRAERAELEPAHVQLAGVFRRRHEAADVGAPERNAREARVDRDRHVRLQRLPRRVDVARPEERAVALHAGVAVAMQRERPLVRAIQLRPFPVHADAREARRGRRGRRPDRATSRRRRDRTAACDTASSTAPRDRPASGCRRVRPLGTALSGVHGSATAPPIRRPSMTMWRTTLKCCACSSSMRLLRDRESSRGFQPNSPLRVFHPDGVNSVPR